MASIEEKVEEHYKNLLKSLGLRIYAKTEPINDTIAAALKNSDSKSGGSGNNYPDIKFILENSHRRVIPVMIEAKGSKNKLEKLDKGGAIIGITYFESDGKPGKDGTPSHLKGEPNYTAVKNFAVNGAVHYGNAILNETDYDEVIVIGINGAELDGNGNVKNPEYKAYYISKKNEHVPKHIKELDKDWSLFAPRN